MKTPGTLLLIVVLSAASWVAFYMVSLPLDVPGTGVVCGFWLALVLLVKWIASRRAAAKKPERSA